MTASSHATVAGHPVGNGAVPPVAVRRGDPFQQVAFGEDAGERAVVAGDDDRADPQFVHPGEGVAERARRADRDGVRLHDLSNRQFGHGESNREVEFVRPAAATGRDYGNSRVAA
jgi:hypothetical protein